MHVCFRAMGKPSAVRGGKGKGKIGHGGQKGVKQRPGAGVKKAGASRSRASAGEKDSAKRKHGADVFEVDEEVVSDKKKRDDLRRFAGVDIYEYEQPEHFDDEDDEEIDEDGAFDEDDYDRFGDVGAARKKRNNRSDEEDDDNDGDANAGETDDEDELEGIFRSDGEDSGGGTDEDEAGAGGGGDSEEDAEDDEVARHQKLMALVRNRQEDTADETSSGFVPATMEGEFAAPAPSQALSLSSLLGGAAAQKTGALRSVAKELGKLEAKKAVAVPAPTVVTARATREAAYLDTSNTVGNWQPIVKQNREELLAMNAR